MLQLLFIVMIVFAVLTVQTNKVIRAVVYMGIFSLACSFCYLLYKAPDVAIAEAVIGSTLSTILFLVAFKKHKVIKIYYKNQDDKAFDADFLEEKQSQVIDLIERFFFMRELQPSVVYTDETEELLKENNKYDMIVCQKGNTVEIYGCQQNYHMEALKKHIASSVCRDIRYSYHYISEDTAR